MPDTDTLAAFAGGLLLAGLAFAVLLVVRGVVQRRAVNRLPVSVLREALDRTARWTLTPVLVVVALGLGSIPVPFNPGVRTVIFNGVVFSVLLQVAIWIDTMIVVGFERAQEKQPAGSHATLVTGFIGFAVRCTTWSVAVILLLDNIGVDVTALVASAGIGGVALALAAQGVLADALASFAIVFDRPFSVGDFIVVGEHEGTVEHIGLKTTRLTSSRGERLVFPNADLLAKPVRNFGGLRERRGIIRFLVQLTSEPGQLEGLPGVVRETLSRIGGLTVVRIHLVSLEDEGLRFEVSFAVSSGSYSVFLDRQQDAILAILRTVRQRGVRLADPVPRVSVGRGEPGMAVPGLSSGWGRTP